MANAKDLAYLRSAALDLRQMFRRIAELAELYGSSGLWCAADCLVDALTRMTTEADQLDTSVTAVDLGVTVDDALVMGGKAGE